MLKFVDRTFAVMLVLGAEVGHTFGSIKSYGAEPMVLLWALNASAFGVLLGALHILRSYRANDRPLAWLLAVGTGAFALSTLRFGQLLGNLADVRVLIFTLISAVLIVLSLRTALRVGVDRP